MNRNDDFQRAVTSTDLVRAYRDNPRISKVLAQRLADLTNDHEPYNFADLQRIVAEENARLSERYDDARER